MDKYIVDNFAAAKKFAANINLMLIVDFINSERVLVLLANLMLTLELDRVYVIFILATLPGSYRGP